MCLYVYVGRKKNDKIVHTRKPCQLVLFITNSFSTRFYFRCVQMLSKWYPQIIFHKRRKNKWAKMRTLFVIIFFPRMCNIWHWSAVNQIVIIRIWCLLIWIAYKSEITGSFFYNFNTRFFWSAWYFWWRSLHDEAVSCLFFLLPYLPVFNSTKLSWLGKPIGIV